MGCVIILRPKSGPLPDSHAQWTASRCLRLLRPISSRLDPLRRLARSEQPSRTRPAPAPSDEPVWLNPRGKKRTYSRAQQKRDDSPPASPTFQIPTPFRAPGPHPEVLDSSPIPAPARETSRRTRGSDDRNELEQGLARGLEELLRRTADVPSDRGRRVGAPSLVETCLVNVPAVIKGEVAWRKAQDPDCNEDVLGEMYGDLEGWGPHAEAGYKGLRKVVRAHGLGLVLEMVRYGLLSEGGLVRIGGLIERHGTRAERVSLSRELLYAGSLQKLSLGEKVLKQTSHNDLITRRLENVPTIVVGHGLKDGAITLACFALPIWKTWFKRVLSSMSRSVANVEAGLSNILEAACLGPTSEVMLSSHSAEGITQKGSFAFASIATKLGSCALWAGQQEDERSDMSPHLRSILAAVATTVIRHTNADDLQHITQVESRALVATTLLKVVLALQLLAPTNNRDQLCIPYRPLIKALEAWSQLAPDTTPRDAATKDGEMMLLCMLRGGGAREQSDEEARVKAFLDSLLVLTKELDRDHAAFAKNLALRVAHSFDAWCPSQGSQAIVRSVELQLEEVDVLADPEECMTRREGIQRWSLAALEKTRNDCKPLDDSGYSSLGSNAHTPPRRARVIDVTSPDELAVSTDFRQADGELDSTVISISESPSRTASEEVEQVAISEASPQFVWQAEGTVQIVRAGDDPDDWDELMFSAKKRQVPPESQLSTRNHIGAKRARQTAPAPESDDELL